MITIHEKTHEKEKGSPDEVGQALEPFHNLTKVKVGI